MSEPTLAERNGVPPADADEEWPAGPCDLAHGADGNNAFIVQSYAQGRGMEFRYPCGCVKTWFRKDQP